MRFLIRFLSLLCSFLLLAFSLASAQEVSVSFNVNMSYQISEGNFNADTDFVDVAGSFNGWDGEAHTLADENGDEIYSVEIGGFSPGNTIEFKFRINGAWDGNEEFPGGGPNRTYTITEDDNEILVWYNDELPATGPPIAGFSPESVSIYENGTVWFSDRSGGLVTEWQWYFDGGTPSSSTERNPVVSYQNPGMYDVTLIAGHEDLADTLTIEHVVEVGTREQTDTHWWNDAVFYEIFVRSFFDTNGDGVGDFQGMTEKLNYLNDGDPESGEDLGITGIWLMPIHQSPSYHGYDVTDYTSVSSDYGTMDEFKTFLEAAQERGIRVIIDFVMNHSSNQHPWFIKSRQNVEGYRDYYRWRPDHPGYNGPWGQPVWHSWGGHYYYGLFWSGMPDINFAHQPVKEKMFEAADFWINEIGVDGFRLDAVTYIFEDGDQLEHTDETFEFWHEFNQHVKSSNPEAVTVGEAWTNTEQIIPYVTEDRLDLAFEFDLSYAILNAVRNGNASNLHTQMQKVYNSYNYLQFATFLTNHDQNRVMNELNNNWEQAKAAASIYLTLPGVPFIYYGEEIGMTGSKPDPQIRTPMQWTDGSNAGFTTGTPWIGLNSDFHIRNVAVQQTDPNSLLNWYKSLISVRNAQPALRTGSYQPVMSSHDSVFAFLREENDERLLVVINTSSTDHEQIDLMLAGSQLLPGEYEIENLLKGDMLSLTVGSSNRLENVSIDAYDAFVLPLSEVIPVSLEPQREQAESFRLDQNYPNPFNPSTTIRYHVAESAEISIQVYNVLGQRVWNTSPAMQNAGTHQVIFDARGLSSGIYFYQLHADGNLMDSRKMLLLK